MKRILVILTFVLLIGLLPAVALAEGTDNTVSLRILSLIDITAEEGGAIGYLKNQEYQGLSPIYEDGVIIRVEEKYKGWTQVAGSADDWNVKLEWPLGGTPILTFKDAKLDHMGDDGQNFCDLKTDSETGESWYATKGYISAVMPKSGSANRVDLKIVFQGENHIDVNNGIVRGAVTNTQYLKNITIVGDPGNKIYAAGRRIGISPKTGCTLTLENLNLEMPVTTNGGNTAIPIHTTDADLTIKNCTITAGNNINHVIAAMISGNITITDSTIDIYSKRGSTSAPGAIHTVIGSITITNSKITIESDNNTCINGADGIIITNSTLDLNSGYYCFYSADGVITVNGGSVLAVSRSGAFWKAPILNALEGLAGATEEDADCYDETMYRAKWLKLTSTGTVTPPISSPLSFTANSDGYYVSNCNRAYQGVLEIPATYNGKPVTGIGQGAFEECTRLTGVIIPSSVTSIGDSAFSYCSSLASVTIPNSTTSIGKNAFFLCETLTYVKIPYGVTIINEGPFRHCKSLTGISIPDSVTTIEMGAFNNCTSLQTVTIPEGVNSIGSSVFDGCTSLTNVNIPDGVTVIDFATFRNCNLTSVTLPDGVKTIACDAFAFCSNLSSINIPASVTTIENFAFCDCKSLVSVIIPNGVTSIETGTFDNCTSLESVTLPAGLTKIGKSAFGSCKSLTSITIPVGVTSISSSVFNRCVNLKSIIIPAGVTSIGDMAFVQCSSLTSINIPDSVTTIGSYAFSGCTNLKDVTFNRAKEFWDMISISTGNNDLNNATLHCKDMCVGNPVYSDWTTVKRATCMETGMRERVCYHCKRTRSESIAITEHAYVGGVCADCKVEFTLNVVAYNRSAAIINTSGANIWTKPYTSGASQMVRTAQYDTKVNVAGYAYNASGSLWYKLSDGNWVYSTNIRVTDYKPEDVEKINKVFVVTSWGANVWSKPYSSGDSKVVYSIDKAVARTIVTQVRNSTGGLWYQLIDGGWIYSKNVNERIFDPANVIAYKRSATITVPAGANIWSQPATSAPSKVARVAAYQTKVNVVAKYTTPAGGLWYQLSDGNWVYSANVRITDYNPADVQAVDMTVTVTSWGANIWSKPYSSGDSVRVKVVNKAANLKIDGQVRNSTYGLWYHLADGSGWIYSNNVAMK